MAETTLPLFRANNADTVVSAARHLEDVLARPVVAGRDGSVQRVEEPQLVGAEGVKFPSPLGTTDARGALVRAPPTLHAARVSVEFARRNVSARSLWARARFGEDGGRAGDFAASASADSMRAHQHGLRRRLGRAWRRSDAVFAAPSAEELDLRGVALTGAALSGLVGVGRL
jgi:hypothetical protein